MISGYNLSSLSLSSPVLLWVVLSFLLELLESLFDVFKRDLVVYLLKRCDVLVFFENGCEVSAAGTSAFFEFRCLVALLFLF